MIKMNYPADIHKRQTMEERFYASLSANMDETSINALLQGAKFRGSQITLKTILTASFDDLNLISEAIKLQYAGNAADLATLKANFDYTNQRWLLYQFFIAEDILGNLALCTCYYCNIDFINVYDNSGGFINKVHFLNNSTERQLNRIPGIASATSQKIIAERENNPIKNLSLSFLSKGKQESIRKFKLQQDKGIFTLDHFYPQHSSQELSISLYNLIPSCAPCNSRFKHEADFEIGVNTTYLSPSSDNYAIDSFQLFGLLLRPGKNISNVSSISDIYLTYEGYIFGQEEFLDIFNIPGRYSFHKKEAVKLILKSQRYPETYIAEIEKSLKFKVDQSTIKKDLFGDDLFDKKECNQPLSKLRRDIAKQIGLIS